MRFGVREICDVVFKARHEMKIGNTTYKKGQPVLYIDTAKTSTLEGAASTVYAQGGKGNPRLVAWESERTVTFTVEDALISPLSFAMLTGAGLANFGEASKNKKIRVHTTFDLPILDGGVVKIDLDTAGDNHDIVIDDDTPVFGMILDNAGAGVVPCQLSKVSGVTANCGVYTITRDETLVLTFTEAYKYVGKTLRVDCYAEKTGGATEMTIDAENFAGTFYVEASTLFREQSSAKDMPAEIVLPNVKIQSNFTFSMAASGDPSTFSFVMDAFPDYTAFDHQHKVFAAIQIVGEENIHPADPDQAKDTTCAPLPFEVQVYAGTGEFNEDYTQFQDDPDEVQFKSLGSYLSATADRANIDFKGTLRRVDNWTAFSDKPADLTGYYYPFSMVAVDDKGQPMTGNVTMTYTTLSGVSKTTKFVGSKLDTIFAIDPNAPVYTMTFSNGTDNVIYSMDFSRVNFA